MDKGYLILENGDIYEGSFIGKAGEACGEVVFNTSMTGYQEIVSDPSYAGQIVVFCYPMIGNYGMNSFDFEADTLHLSGVIIGEHCDEPSHFQANQSFSEQLRHFGVAGLAGIDTRSLTKKIRKHGTLKGWISDKSFAGKKKEWISDFSSSQVPRVSVKEPEAHGNKGPHVVLVDYGYKKSILDSLLEEGCRVTVVPYNYTYQQISDLNPDALLLSNGPGDPMALAPLFPEIKKMAEALPTLGICLGHQLIALAFGGKTEKMKFGHRGANHPVKELETGKVWITSQNHGYEVIEDTIDQGTFNIAYKNVNDNSVEGLKHKTLPLQTVQFHPEANAGPNDTAHIFKKFVQQLAETGEMLNA